MSLPALAIRNPVFAWMLMLGFIVFGGLAFFRLGVGQYPDVDVPVISITATLEGAAPEIMESEVVDVLEDAVMAVEGVKNVSSSARLGRADVTAEFSLKRDIDLALQDIQARVSAALRILPKDLDPPVIRKTNPEDRPIMWVALTGARSPQFLSDYAKNVLRDRFLTVPGDGDVRMGGFLERNVRIWIDPRKLNARGLTVDDVIGAIRRQHAEAPAGRIEGLNREANVRVEGEALNVEEWRQLVLAENDGAPLRLGDVALVEDGFEDRRRISRIDGIPAQGLGIIKQHGANTVALARACRRRVAELNRTLPADLELSVRYDSSRYIETAISETEFTLLLSVLLTALVCWLFLGSFSSTFNVILAIPVSVLGTIAAMYFLGFTLNTFTLLALMLSIGIVVDDAVMVLENIYRHAEGGAARARAAREGAEQISFAALAATLSIVAIFLPVAFMSGLVGKFFFQFGIVLSVAVLISLLEALTLAPSRCAQFLRVGTRRNPLERGMGHALGGLARAYRRLLRGALRWRLTVLFLAVLLFLASLLPVSVALSGWLLGSFPKARARLAKAVQAVPQLPSEMVPAQDQGVIMLLVRCPVGSTIHYTNQVMRKIEEKLAAREELDSGFVIVGGFRGEGNEGVVFIPMKPRAQRRKTQQQSIRELRRELNVFPGTRVIPIDLSRRGLPGARGRTSPVQFSLRGPDWNRLGELARSFEQAMNESGMMVDVDSSYRVGMPEVQVTPNREKTLAHHVDVRTLSEAVSALIGGKKIAKYSDRGRRYDVRLRLLRSGRVRPEDIGALYVRNTSGQRIKLSELVDIRVRPSLQLISHENRERAVSVSASPAPGISQGRALKEVERLAAKLLPDGYRLVFSGQSQVYRESILSWLFALGLGLVVAYMVLASQFNSFLHPFTVLLALPFSISGALLTLLLMGQSLNMYSLIGIILLTGIVKKNAILLVDFTNQMRAEGKSCDEALREACPIRLRPILMTSTATIGGALPAAIAWGPGGELRVPMAVAVIGGVAVSTLLTLFVVPCFYSLADQAQRFVRRGFHGRAAAPAVDKEKRGLSHGPEVHYHHE